MNGRVLHLQIRRIRLYSRVFSGLPWEIHSNQRHGANPRNSGMSSVRIPGWTGWMEPASAVLPWPAALAGPGWSRRHPGRLGQTIQQSGPAGVCSTGKVRRVACRSNGPHRRVRGIIVWRNDGWICGDAAGCLGTKDRVAGSYHSQDAKAVIHHPRTTIHRELITGRRASWPGGKIGTEAVYSPGIGTNQK